MLYSLSEPLVFIPDSPAGVINTHLSGYLTLQPYSRGGVSHGQSPWLWWLSQMRSVFTPSAYLQRRIGSSCVEQPELGVGRGGSEYVVLGVRSWLRQGLWASCRHLHLIPWISVKMFINRPQIKLAVGQESALTILWLSVLNQASKRIKEQTTGN